MSKRAGLRSPASAASRMRVASSVLLDCARWSADNELHARSSATCTSLIVSRLNCLFSPTLTDIPKEQGELLTLPEGPAPRLFDVRPTVAKRIERTFRGFRMMSASPPEADIRVASSACALPPKSGDSTRRLQRPSGAKKRRIFDLWLCEQAHSALSDPTVRFGSFR